MDHTSKIQTRLPRQGHLKTRENRGVNLRLFVSIILMSG